MEAARRHEGTKERSGVFIDGMYWIPVAHAGDIDALKAELTFTSKMPNDDRGPLLLYDMTLPGYIGVPRAFGIRRWGLDGGDDRMSDGHPIEPVPRLPDPRHPRVKDPEAQERFMSALDEAMNLHHDFVGMAGTGTGKTVSSLRTAAVRERTTLIVVHTKRLLVQWRGEIAEKLGVPEDEIGTIQGKVCDVRGKRFVVAMLKSLATRTYPAWVYSHFGIVIFDELHRMGAPLMSKALGKFAARRRLGLSATPHRKDGAESVIFAHLGEIEVVSKATVLPLDVIVEDYVCPPDYELWGKQRGARIKCLSQDERRNAVIVRWIVRMYRQGRHGLIVGDVVDHLQHLMTLCEAAGIPRSAMGQYTGERKVKVREGGRIVIRKEKIEDAEYERVKAESQLIFATYGLMTEGVDIPRLDCGIDATPRSSSIQVTGRIRRPMPGKRRPVWVTIRDRSCTKSMNWWTSRRLDYIKTGAIIRESTGVGEPKRRGERQ